MPCGFDWTAVEAQLPDGCDRERVKSLLRSMEAGLLSGAIQSAEDARERAKSESHE